jgi:two-component system, chemotaxis family, CheB/CheR fusion protein
LVALARAHNLTLANCNGEAKPDQVTTLSEVVETITAPYANRDRAPVVINGPDVPIKGKSVMSVALLLHEVATNAAKYGALSSPSGRVEVSWSVQQNELLLTWRERGGPPINGPPEHQGFGSLLTQLAVTGQLSGKISRDWSQEGLTLSLSAPLDRLVN